MIGLMLLAFIVAYLTLSIFVTKKTFGWAKDNNRKPWLWGGLAAFVMYNLVFWDWIPTVVAHKYYCSTQAGFFVYKTPEQWKEDNSELTAEDLILLGDENSEGTLKSFRERRTLKSDPNKKVTMINNQIYYTSSYERNIAGLVPIHKHTYFFADIDDDQKLAAEITFGSGYRDPMGVGGLTGFKYWLANSTCSNSTYERPPELIDFINQIFALGR